MKDFEDFLPDVLIHAAAVPEPTAILYLRRAAQEFCTKTKLWREVDCLPATGGEFETVCVPPYSALVQLESVSLNGRDLFPLRGDRHAGRDGGEPDYFTQTGPDQMRLVPCGGSALVGQEMRMSMILKPAEGAEMTADFLYDHHVEAIAAGALSRILMLPNQPYTDLARAGVFAGQFQAELDRLMGASIKGQQRANVRSRSRFL
jgi:hypothetical protein